MNERNVQWTLHQVSVFIEEYWPKDREVILGGVCIHILGRKIQVTQYTHHKTTYTPWSTIKQMLFPQKQEPHIQATILGVQLCYEGWLLNHHKCKPSRLPEQQNRIVYPNGQLILAKKHSTDYVWCNDTVDKFSVLMWTHRSLIS